jgi:hydrophobe/amphiphile efflux-1 (HAE1) family protein
MSGEQKKRRAGVPSWSIRRPIGTLMLTSVILVLGFFFLSGLPLDLLPQIVYPQVRVNVSNSGVEPEVLEETIAKRLEAALATTQNLERIETDIQEGRVGINLNFKQGTDIDFALQDASKNLERARSSLPVEADPPTINKSDPNQSPVYEVGFSSEARDLISLRDWVEYKLRPQLLTTEGVASVDVSGGLIREVQVILDQERLRSYGLTVSQIINALGTSNQDVAAGRIASPTREVVGKTAGKFRNVEQIRSLLLVLPNGGRVPLSEVATVQDVHREQRLWARLDGVQAVKLSIRKQPDANTVTVAEGVAKRIEALSRDGFIPRDIHHVTTTNQADFIRGSVGSVRDAALTGAILSMIVVLLFLGSLRKTFIIGLSIPIAILATFLMMGLGHLTLNIMSLGGLALGVGMLVDNSIVMLENIFRHSDEGESDPEEAAHVGAAEVQSAVVAATTTHLSAVVPFLIITGLAALIFRELILTISFSIAASLLVAMSIVPMLAAQLAKIRFTSGAQNWRLMRFVDRLNDGLCNFYRNVTPHVIRWRFVVFTGGMLTLFGAYWLTKDLGSEFLPTVDDGNVSVNINLPPGSSAEMTNKVALELEQMVSEMPHVEHVFATAGGFLFGSSTAERAGRGSLAIQLSPLRERKMSANEWVQMLQRRIEERGFPGARIFVRPPSIRGLRTSVAGSPIAIDVQGDDLRELRKIAEEIMVRVRDVPGLQNFQPSAEEASPQLAIELDRERASYLGLNVATVGQTLRTALDGTIATRYTEGNREYDVRVMFPRARFQSPEDLGSVALFPPTSRGGAPIYLRDVARVYSSLGPTTISRTNQNRIVRLTGDNLPQVASVGTVNDSIRARLADLDLPDGYGIIFGGEEEAMKENNRQLMIVAFLAIFLVFVVMAVQYESVINPLVILFTIPLSLIGVGAGLWVTNTPLSAPVLLGVIMLAGIVVNNGILLVEYVEQNRQEGATMEEAVVTAGMVRLRPILMTSLTTMLGMLPLALGIGEGTELMRPLAIAVVGGMTLSTVLTLFVVPSAYVIFNRAGDTVQRWLTGGAKEKGGALPTPVEVAGD